MSSIQGYLIGADLPLVYCTNTSAIADDASIGVDLMSILVKNITT